MKISHILCAAVLGATLVATTQTASADRWYHGGWGYAHRGWYAPRVYTRPYWGPRVVVSPGYVDPYYAAPAPVVYTRPAVVVRPRPYYVRRGWYRRW